MHLLIYGSKEFALTVAELVRHCGHETIGMVDDFNCGPGILGNLETVSRDFPPGEYGMAVAIGYSNIAARWGAWEKIRAKGYKAPTLVHPRAYVADTAQIGEGCMVMAGAIVDVRARLGELVVAWPGACINHDANIGGNSFLAPNTTICGFADVGANTFVGAGSVIADHCLVPDASFLKMQTRYTGRAE